MNRRKYLVWALRLAALGEFPAFATAVMPFPWMAAVHRCLGLGELPALPVVEYMARSLSLAYGLHAIMLWVIASDVERYRVFVTLHVYGFLLLVPTFLLI